MIAGDDGAFVLFEREDELLPAADMPAEVLERVRSMAYPTRLLAETPDSDGRWWGKAVMKYGGAIFECNFDIHVEGLVQARDGMRLVRGLPLLAETFKGGLRSLHAFEAEGGIQFQETQEATGE